MNARHVIASLVAALLAGNAWGQAHVWGTSESGFISEVIVTQASQLTGTLDSSVIYTIDGSIDMGSNTIEVPSTGLTIQGFGFDISKLTSTTGNSTGLFVSPSDGSGNLFLTGLTFDYNNGSGNAKVFELDDTNPGAGTQGFSAVEMNDVNFENTDDIGTLTDYRQILMRNIGVFSTENGLELDGDMVGGARIETTLVRSFDTGGAGNCVIRAGSALILRGRFITDANVSITSPSCFTDIDEDDIASDARFQIIGATFSGTGTVLGGTMTTTSPKARVRNTTGLRDTYPGGEWTLTTETATTFSVAGEAGQQKVLGTTTYDGLEWFSQTTDNAFVYDSTEEIEVDIHGQVAITGTAGETAVLKVRQWDDSASAYVDIATTPQQSLDRGGSGNKAESVGFIVYTVLNENDRIEVWIYNATTGPTSTNSMTLLENSTVIIEER